MNGFLIMAESYRKLMEDGIFDKESAEKGIRIYEFLATCDLDDFCLMVDSSAFNDIIRAYLNKAVEYADIDETSQDKVKNQIRSILDEIPAKEVLRCLKTM